MLILRATTDLIRAVTGSAASVDYFVSVMETDNSVPPVVQDIPAPGNGTITTATTTTVIDCTTANRRRNVKFMSFYNNHSTQETTLRVEKYDGSAARVLANVTLLPGEMLAFDENGNWTHYDRNGAPYSYTPPADANLGITGTLAETIPRQLCPEVNSTIPSASGTLFMQAIYLYAGQVINNIILSSATTAAGTPTNAIAGLYDSGRNLLAQTANQTTTAWAANTLKTLALTAAYRVPTSGLYYIGFFMTATTIITMKGGTARTSGSLAGTAPILSGTSTTGLTTALPTTAAALTASTASLYAAVS